MVFSISRPTVVRFFTLRYAGTIADTAVIPAVTHTVETLSGQLDVLILIARKAADAGIRTGA